MSKAEHKRVRKRANPLAQSIDQLVADDLLSQEPAPRASSQASKTTETKATTAAKADDTAPPAVLEEKMTEEKTPLAEAVAVSEPLEQASEQTPEQTSIQKETNQESPPETTPAVEMDAPPVAEQDTTQEALTAGALLKAAREAAGFSIEEVSRPLKLAPRQVHALEQHDFAALPPRAFVRGFMRNYARFLNIDANAVLDALPPEAPQTASSIKAHTVLSTYGEKTVQPQTWKWLFAIAFLAIVAAAFFFWPQITALIPERFTATTGDAVMPVFIEEVAPPFARQEIENARALTPIITPLSETSAELTTSTPAPTDPSTASAAAEHEEAELILRFTGDSWVEVRDRHDSVLYSAIAREGSERTLRGAPPFSLVFGNSSVATVILRGKPVDMSGQSRQGVARLVLE